MQKYSALCLTQKPDFTKISGLDCSGGETEREGETNVFSEFNFVCCILQICPWLAWSYSEVTQVWRGRRYRFSWCLFWMSAYTALRKANPFKKRPLNTGFSISENHPLDILGLIFRGAENLKQLESVTSTCENPECSKVWTYKLLNSVSRDVLDSV